MWRKRIQLGLIHTAVAITLVPINGVLNRVMIKELAIAATVVALLVSLPYLLSPIQVAIGSYSDRNPIFGLRRTPYILAGLLLCIAGALIAPHAAFALAEGGVDGWLLSVLAFGLWGMGYNLSAVSYLSLASELDPAGRSRTIAVMFFLMFSGLIATAIVVSHMVDPYTPAALIRAVWLSAGLAAALGLGGLLWLEPRFERGEAAAVAERDTWGEMLGEVFRNRQARIFFWYLLLLLAAILGQDVLLEPYGGEAFGLTPSQTARITAIWGGFVLVTLVMAGTVFARVPKRTIVRIGNWGALVGFVLLAASGLVGSVSVFWLSITLLGLATGFATVSNLSLMLDMTTPQNVGLFIGAWGVANALSRLAGQVVSGALRDAVALAAGPVIGYVVAFGVMGGFVLAAIVLLSRIDVSEFQAHAQQQPLSLVESAALMHEAHGG